MEPNGVGSPTQNLGVAPGAQQAQQPGQQQIQQPQQIGGTGYQQVNPQQGPQQQVTQPQTQQQAGGLQELRQHLAQAAGVPLDQVPADVATLSRIVLGGLGAQQELGRYRQQQATQAPAQQPASGPQTQQQQLQPVQMPPGWESMVTKTQQGVYEPTHPAFAQVAQLANQNFAVQQMRQNVIQSGQLLPEHEKLINDRAEAIYSEKWERQRQDDFVEQHGQELFQHGTDGQRLMQWNPMTNKQEPVMSDFGLAFNAAADELARSGAQFPSKYQHALLAMKLAKERTKQSAPASRPNGTPPGQAVNQDLAALFNNHNNTNTQRVPNVNGVNPQTGHPTTDLRAAMRNVFADLPSVAPGTEYARAIGFNV